MVKSGAADEDGEEDGVKVPVVSMTMIMISIITVMKMKMIMMIVGVHSRTSLTSP